MIEHLVSVIIPCYNRQQTIKRAIESVLNQTYKNLEVIVVDDHSSDASVKMIGTINDSRLKIYTLEENHGACFARNYGVSKAQGEFIAFQDSDDFWKRDKLEKQIKYLKDNDLEFVSTSFTRYENGKGRTFGVYDCPKNKDDVFQRLLDHNWVSTQTILCYSKCFQKISFDSSIKRFQDWDLALQASQFFKIGSLNENLVDVYLQPNSITCNNNSDEEKLKILRKYQKRACASSKSLKSQYFKSLADVKRHKFNIEAAYLYYQSFCLYPKLKTMVWSVMSLFGFGKIYRERM